jgi:hypothetical protein
MIRARMEELRRKRARPRAADDFRMIRTRMEELRRERAQVSAERDTLPLGPHSHHGTTSVSENGRRRHFSRAIHQKLSG